jgi:transposase
MIDSFVVRVRQHAANGEKKRPKSLHGPFPRWVYDQDPRGRRRPRPRDRAQADRGTGPRRHDRGAKMLDTLGPDCILLADRGYDSDALRGQISERGPYADIRPLDHRVDPPTFSPRVYKLRNKVERFFNRIKHYRAIATSYDKQDANYLASVKLAAIRILIGFKKSVT